MKRWAVLTVLLYALALLLLTVPVMLVAFGNWARITMVSACRNALQIYLQWGYWLWLAVLVAGQALLLLLPINIAERRLPARRPLKIPVIVTGIFSGQPAFRRTLVNPLRRFQGRRLWHFRLFSRVQANEVAPSNLQHRGRHDRHHPLFWFIWAVIFRRSAKSDDPDALLKRTTRWLLRGSILELLVAVPSHVIVRRRDDCCAPAGTFWGIATGISVMLLCFGPGVFFLFVERFRG